MSLLLDEEKDALKNCKTEKEWDDICDSIRSSHGGEYPDDWFEVVVTGRLNENLNLEMEIITTSNEEEQCHS